MANVDEDAVAGQAAGDWELLSEILRDDTMTTTEPSLPWQGYAEPPHGRHPPESPRPLVMYSNADMAMNPAPAPPTGFLQPVRSASHTIPTSSGAMAPLTLKTPPTASHTSPFHAAVGATAVPTATTTTLNAATKQRTVAPTLSKDEIKRRRRRRQVASSVQRHRDKKKLETQEMERELATLTETLLALRAAGQDHPLMNLQEAAVKQRRKRRQSEQDNLALKRELFQRTAYLMGLRQLLTRAPTFSELHIHDYLHSFTVISAGSAAVRHSEYLESLPDSKMMLAYQAVMRETDPEWARLIATNGQYYAHVRVLHDGTGTIRDEQELRVDQELREPASQVLPGRGGQVVKKYSSVFVFPETEACTFPAFFTAASEATKEVGVFWPSHGFSSEVQEAVPVDATSMVLFADLHGPLAAGVCHDVPPPSLPTDMQLEARMLCRVRTSADEAVIVWDYIDQDKKYPHPGNCTGDGVHHLRRDTCGAAVARRETNGTVSLRSVSVKIYAPIDAQTGEVDAKEEDALAIIQRRIGLQASEVERHRLDCLRSVYDALKESFPEPLPLRNAETTTETATTSL